MKRIVLVLLLLGCMAGTAHAALWELTATSASSDVSDFSIVFNDADDDKTVTIGDVVSFSGVTFNTNFFSKIYNLSAMTVSDFTLSSTSSDFWIFVGLSIREYKWSYSVAPVTTPIPGAAWLLGTGVAGLLSLRRKLRS